MYFADDFTVWGRFYLSDAFHGPANYDGDIATPKPKKYHIAGPDNRGGFAADFARALYY